jgi:hypothetical protein
MWKLKDNTNNGTHDVFTKCMSEVQTRFLDENGPRKDWNGTFANAQCLQVEIYTRWKQSSVECASEQWL